ncbi:hypothetical protein GGR22_001264 [Flavobacterium gossypii]|uniref:Uncharacterized protein n=1 Tax=Flavobacterium gossypii TaxID=1646119 RepID=A0ABR6DN78_9FLAO|nr:hypothetical protein [Flavobacterium gossypii]
MSHNFTARIATVRMDIVAVIVTKDKAGLKGMVSKNFREIKPTAYAFKK